VQVQNKDEVGQLVEAMGRMQEALRGLVRQVQEAAGNTPLPAPRSPRATMT